MAEVCWKKVAVFAGVAAFWLAVGTACYVQRDEADLVGADSDTVAAINRHINRVRPHADASLPDGTYDCEDYAFAKLEALNAAGLTGAQVWRVTIENGEAHAIVLLPDGRVMDNRFSDIVASQQLADFNGYRFIARMTSLDDAGVINLATMLSNAEAAR